ncbi:MAG: NUDIX domain-containing protein [Gammaproteobacteria bacterium]
MPAISILLRRSIDIAGRDLSQSDYIFCPLSGHPLERVLRGGRERAVCTDPDCGFVHWDNPVPIVAAIVEHDGQVVLVRSIGRPSTWYGLVAGFLEAREHPDEAVLREIEEEVGLVPTRCTFLGSYAFARLNQIIFAYHAEVPSLDITLCTEELDDYRIIPIAELRPWSQGTGPALRDWLAGRGFHRAPVEFGEHV